MQGPLAASVIFVRTITFFNGFWQIVYAYLLVVWEEDLLARRHLRRHPLLPRRLLHCPQRPQLEPGEIVS